ncbi:hypothetical protein HDU89_006332 [Geranomyces variabilis]|nr:hypothetical protein HDU89_006332 [Geranomyces variabilis]
MTARRRTAAVLLLVGRKRASTTARGIRNNSNHVRSSNVSSIAVVNGNGSDNNISSSSDGETGGGRGERSHRGGDRNAAGDRGASAAQLFEPPDSALMRELLKQDPPDTRHIISMLPCGTANGFVSPHDVAWAIAELDPCDVPPLYRILRDSGLSFSSCAYNHFLAFASERKKSDFARLLYHDIVETWEAVECLSASPSPHWQESTFFRAVLDTGDPDRLKWATARLVREHPHIVSPKLIRHVLEGRLINADLQGAVRLYEVLVAESVRLCAASYSHFLRIASRFRNAEFATKLLVDMEFFGVEADSRMLNSALSASRREDAEHGAWLAEFARQNVQPTISTVSILLQQLFAKPGFHPKVFAFVEQAVASEKVDLIFFSIVIDYLNRHGRVADAAILLNVIKKRHIIPDASIYGSMASGYLALNQPAKAEAILKEMIDDGLVPNVFFFTKIIAGCLRANDCRAAFRVLDQMPSSSQARSTSEPSRPGRKSARTRRHEAHIMGVFLAHCARTNNPDLATTLLQDLQSRGFQADRKVYTQLIYIFRYDFAIVQRLWAEMNARRARGGAGGGSSTSRVSPAQAPDALAFRNYLEAIMLSTRDLGRVRRVFYEMRRAGVKHTAAVCDILLWAYGCGFESRVARGEKGEAQTADRAESNNNPGGAGAVDSGNSGSFKLPPRTRDYAASRAAVLDFMATELDIRPTVYAMNQLLRALAKRGGGAGAGSGSLDAARACFRDIERRTGGHRPNAHSYAAVIREAARQAQWETVAQFAGAARRDGVVLLGLTQGSVERARKAVGDAMTWARWEESGADELSVTGTGDGWDTVRDVVQFLAQPARLPELGKVAKQPEANKAEPRAVHAPWPPDMAPPPPPDTTSQPRQRDTSQPRRPAMRRNAVRRPGFDNKPER